MADGARVGLGTEGVKGWPECLMKRTKLTEPSEVIKEWSGCRRNWDTTVAIS